MLIELAKSGNLDLNQFPESIRQKISQIRQNEGMILYRVFAQKMHPLWLPISLAGSDWVVHGTLVRHGPRIRAFLKSQ